MDHLPKSVVATAYIPVQVNAFDEWWAAEKDYLIDFFFCLTQNVIIIKD